MWYIHIYCRYCIVDSNPNYTSWSPEWKWELEFAALYLQEPELNNQSLHTFTTCPGHCELIRHIKTIALNNEIIKEDLNANNRKQQLFYGHFPCLHKGWPAALHSSLLHLSLSIASSLFNLHSLMSLSTTWLHVIFGLPHPLLPSTSNMIFFTQSSSSSFHNTCSNHLNLFYFTVSDTDSIPILSLMQCICKSWNFLCNIKLYLS